MAMRHPLIATLALAMLAAAAPAQACRMFEPLNLSDIHYADLVVVGRIDNYEIVLDQAMRRATRTPEARDPSKPASYLLTDYARFDVIVEKVISGKPRGTVSVTWHNFRYHDARPLPAGPFLIALRDAASPMPPMRGPSATFAPTPEPDRMVVLQAPCSPSFLFENDSDEAWTIRNMFNSGPQ